MLTTAQLDTWGQTLLEGGGLDFAHASKTASVKTRIFLSHSHLDKKTRVAGAWRFLKKFEVTLYVDWADGSMPRTTNHETATKIKQRIEEHDKFIVIATPNALASRWVPWELGIADVLKGIKNVAILPVKEADQTWKGNEYIDTYPHIWEASGGGWGVFPPGSDTNGIYLKHWLARE